MTERCRRNGRATFLVSVLVSVWTPPLQKPLLHTQFGMEARVGIEPTHKAFAEPCLTTWLPRRYRGPKAKSVCVPGKFLLMLEAGNEPALRVLKLWWSKKKWKPGKSRPSVWTAQLASLAPKFTRLINSRRCDDARNELGRSYVKARVQGAAARIRDADVSA